MSCNLKQGKICNFCDECIPKGVVYCRNCKHCWRHDKYFGYCKLNEEQVKLDEYCRKGVRRYNW